MKFALASIFTCLALWSNAQQPLVGVQDGQWFTFINGKKKLLPKEIHDVGNFDNQRLAYFMRYDRYGLLDPNGEIVLSERYIAAEQLKGGYYKFLRKDGFDLIKSENRELKFTNCRLIEDLKNEWYLVTTESKRFLLNTLGDIQFNLDSLDNVVNTFYGYVYLKHGDERILFNPMGQQIDYGKNKPLFYRDYLVLSLGNSKKIIYPDHEIELPEDAVSIIVEENKIHYTTGKLTRIISATDQHLIMEAKCEALVLLGRGLYEMISNNKSGVISKDNVVICPMIYDFVSIRDDYLMINNLSGMGIMDLGGKIILPCVYDWVRPTRDFFLIKSDLGRQGLLSRKTNKVILPCAYKRIQFSDSKIRAWSSNKLRILELDSMHNFTSDLVLDNVITLDKMKATKDESVDSRLYGLGWFSVQKSSFDSLGFKIGDKLRWGLKNPNDSTLLPAKYNQPLYVPQAGFSLVTGPGVILPLSNSTRKVSTFYITSYITGRRLVSEPVFSIDTMDLFSRSYTRFYGTKGFGILTAENKVIYTSYFDGSDRRYVRYCQSESARVEKAEKSDFDHLVYQDALMNNDPAKGIKYPSGNASWEFIRFPDAKWNFFDTNGRSVFDSPFNFVYPYRSETAIVQRDGSWGLVRFDSLVIPTIYSQISRISNISDTLLLIKYTPKGVRFMDTTTRELNLGITRFGMKKGDLTQVHLGSRKGVINSDYQMISGDTRFQKIFENNLFYSKEKKKYTIYSSDGNLVGTVKLKPQGFVRDQYVIVTERGKKGLVNMTDEVIIPIVYKNIEKHGDYIFAVNGFENLLFDKNVNVIRKFKNNSVLVDEMTGNYVIIESDRAVVYSILTGKKTGSWKGRKFTHFSDNWLVQYGKFSRAIDVTSEIIVDFDFEIERIVDMDGAGYIVYDTKKFSHHFTVNWEEITYDSPLRRAKYVGNRRGICRTKNGLLLFGDGINKLFPTKFNFKGVFGSGFLLLGSRNHYMFIDDSGANVFEREFIDATPFGKNFATIKEQTGWTIMNTHGHYKTLPSFDKIKEIGTNIFSTSQQALFGVFDSHGNTIIPVKYQRINVLENNLLQGYKNGKIFYFTVSGKEIILN